MKEYIECLLAFIFLAIGFYGFYCLGKIITGG